MKKDILKNRLLYLALFLLGLVLEGIALHDVIIHNRLEVFEMIFGVYCLLFGGYKAIYPEDK